MNMSFAANLNRVGGLSTRRVLPAISRSSYLLVHHHSDRPTKQVNASSLRHRVNAEHRTFSTLKIGSDFLYEKSRSCAHDTSLQHVVGRALSSSSMPHESETSKTDNLTEGKDSIEDTDLKLELQDRVLPCAEHLDPESKLLPKSSWIHVNGTLPIGTVDHILESIENLLFDEEERGIIDLDEDWNPIQDAQVPLVSLEATAKTKPLVEAAHVVLSPFGRPNGWRLKLANRSLVYAILARAERKHLMVGWKAVKMYEYEYSMQRERKEDPAFTHNDGLIVDDTMVRIENCPQDMNEAFVRYLLSRYELAHQGKTVLRWRGKTNDGKRAPLMFIVRFESASWARAAVRELQSTVVNQKTIKLVQYPRQIRYEEP